MIAWDVKYVRRGFRPLAMKGREIFGYEDGYLVSIDLTLTKISRLIQDPSDSWLKWLGRRVRIIERIFRLGPSTAIYFEDTLYVAHKSTIIAYDIKTKTSMTAFVIPENRGILRFSEITVRQKKYIIFGEYFNNFRKSDVRIWAKEACSPRFEEISKFRNGEIEHIHGIFQVRGRILVLAGDFGDSAGIWELDFDNGKLVPLARGSQSYRSCWLHDDGSFIYYATDSQVEINSLQKLYLLNDNIAAESLRPLPGSSIYSCVSGSHVFFSSAVEPGKPTGCILLDLFSKSPGPGILDRNSKIFSLRPSSDVVQVFTAEKDLFPMRLAQFGTFLFPSGLHPENYLITYGQAVEKWDGCCVVLEGAVEVINKNRYRNQNELVK
jgi:hypothetical protein